MDAATRQRYSRQWRLPVVTEAGQERLAAAHIAIVGAGALGSLLAERLVRTGVGALTLLDRDLVELSNLPRQTLFTERDVEAALPKAVAAVEHLRAINSACRLTPVVAHLNHENAEALLARADLLLDGTDNFQTRYLLNDAAVKWRKPWVYAGVLGTEARCLPILPGTTPCLRCLFPTPAANEGESCERLGVLGTAVGLIANLQATAAIQWLLGGDTPLWGILTAADVWQGTFRSLDLREARDEACPACAAGRFEFLEGKGAAVLSELCGAQSVQVLAPRGTHLDLAALAARLPDDAIRRRNDFLLRVEADGVEVTFFPDGRALVHGVADTNRAVALYDRLIGR